MWTQPPAPWRLQTARAIVHFCIRSVDSGRLLLAALLIMSAGGDGPIGVPATTNALDPTSAELLRILAQRAQAHGQRPRTIFTDCVGAVKGMTAALASLRDGTKVEYYAPPSEEERSAAMTGHAHVAAMNP